MENLVSICILSYNHEKFIPFCVESIWKQKYRNIEILALDDGSNDNSVTVLNSLKEKSPFNMQIIAQENSGCIGGNFNKLINIAKGKYISFISCDDALFEDAISKKIEILEKDEKNQFVINTQVQGIDIENNYIPTSKMPIDEIEKPSAKDILDLEFTKQHSYYIQGSLYRKSIIDAIGGFDDDMIGDDIVLRTKLSNYLIKHPEFYFETFHEPACLYRRHTTNVSAISPRQAKLIYEYLSRYLPDKSTKSFKKAFKRLLRTGQYELFFNELKTRKELRKYVLLVPFWFISINLKHLLNTMKIKKRK